MERYEMAELLSKKAGVTLEEARQALADNEWDILDAMVALERKGRVPQAEPVTVGGRQENGGYYYSAPAQPQPVKSAPKREPILTNGFAQLWEYIKKLVRLLVYTNFVVTRREKEVMALPVIWVVVLLICCFWVTLPALLIGMFVGCKYRFEGMGKAGDSANRAMEKLQNAVDNVKEAIDSQE